MSDSFLNPIFGTSEEPTTLVEGTGDRAVDAVIESLDGLDDLPVAEHVVVFEQAHETLRRALAGVGQDRPAAGRD